MLLQMVCTDGEAAPLPAGPSASSTHVRHPEQHSRIAQAHDHRRAFGRLTTWYLGTFSADSELIDIDFREVGFADSNPAAFDQIVKLRLVLCHIGAVPLIPGAERINVYVRTLSL